MFRHDDTFGLTALVLSALLAVWGCGGGQAEDEGRAGSQAESASDEQGGYWLGEPRQDIERFLGVYGDADNPEKMRGQFFVAEAERPEYAERAAPIPPGYLMIGAMWGDVAPWYMKSVSETRFEHVAQGDFGPSEPIVAEFEFGDGGQSVALTFETVFEEFGRRERLGDLPQKWQ